MQKSCIAGVIALWSLLSGQSLFSQSVLPPEPLESKTTLPPALSLHLFPTLTIPIGDSSRLFSVGGGLTLAGEYRLPFLPAVLARTELNYSVEPIFADQSISIVSATVGGGVSLVAAPFLGIAAYVQGGLTYSFFNPPIPFEGYFNPFTKISLDAHLFLTDILSVHAGTSFLYQIGLYTGLGVSIGASLLLGQTGGAAWGVPIAAGQSPRWKPLFSARGDAPLQGLEVERLELRPLFPVFYTYYDDHPVGMISVKNTLNEILTDVRVSFYIRDYMSTPQQTREPVSILPGESKTIELYALLNDGILEVTERTKLQAEVVVNYASGERKGLASCVESIDVLDRNAMTWEDNRRAAAFVTPKDTVVMGFAKAVVGATKGRANPAINVNLSTAMAMHTVWRLYGITYVVDPKSSYMEFAAKRAAVDYLQFPRQTLSFKAGDCDDLSILACALLESVGIETAFITVPGHIFIAFSLGIRPEDAKKQFLRLDDLIFHGDATWLPLEITEINGGFLKGWELGAKEWREARGRNLAEILPLHEAWTAYQPVFFKGEEAQLPFVSAEEVATVFQQEQGQYLDRIIYPELAKLKVEIQKSGGGPGVENKLGVLYARYGMYDLAEKEFRRIVQKADYLPALLNLGNIRFRQEDLNAALGFYSRAQRLAPGDAAVLLGLARVNHAMENFETTRQLYDKLKKADPKLAEQFAYLDIHGEEATRATNAGAAREMMLWQE